MAGGEGDDRKTEAFGEKTIDLDMATAASRPKAAPKAEAPPTIPEVEVEEEIGRGGMGVVYRGRQPYLDRKVAVKLLLTAGAANAKQFVERFRREAKILAGLSHPNIVGCYQANQLPSGECYLVMEFIDGPNLRGWIEKQGPLSEVHALAVTRDVAHALEHAQRAGIIHRDVKPENVLLQPTALQDSSGARSRRLAQNPLPFTAKLVDLGLARPEAACEGDSGRLTAHGVVMGTPCTMAPEQLDAPDAVDYRADIYGLGCVLYHALTGEPAFPERSLQAIILKKAQGHVPDPKSIRPGLRDDVAALVREMIAPSREARPQSYEAIIARCGELIGQAEQAPAGVGATKRYYKPPEAGSGEIVRSRAAKEAIAENATIPLSKATPTPAAASPAGAGGAIDGAKTAVDPDVHAKAALSREARAGDAGVREGGPTPKGPGGMILGFLALVGLVIAATLLLPRILGTGAPAGPSTSGASASPGGSASAVAGSVPGSAGAATGSATPDAPGASTTQGSASAGVVAPPARVRFAATGDRLYATDENNRVVDWMDLRGTGWATSEDFQKDGISGGPGTGSISRAIGSGPWRVAGTLLAYDQFDPKTGALRPTDDAGVRVDTSAGAVGFGLRNLGAIKLLHVSRYTIDGESGLWKLDRDLGKTERFQKARAIGKDEPVLYDEVPFALSVEGDRVYVEAGGTAFPPVSLEGAAVKGISLFVTKGGIVVRDLRKFRPER